MARRTDEQRKENNQGSQPKHDIDRSVEVELHGSKG